MLNLFQLRAFDAVAREGSFTRAAQRLCISQPAVTGHVKALEARYQVILLRRGARGVSLTPEGERLASITRGLFGLAEEAEAWLQGRREVLGGELRLAADSPQQVMPLIARLRAQHPGVQVHLTLGNARESIQALLDERVDLALTTAVTPRNELYLQALSTSRLCLLLPATHPWAGQAQVPLAHLHGHGMVVREEGSVTRRTLTAACDAAGVTPLTLMTLGSREAIGEAVAAGLGLGVLLSGETHPDPRLHCVPLAGEGLLVSHVLACLARRQGQALLQRVFQMAP